MCFASSDRIEFEIKKTTGINHFQKALSRLMAKRYSLENVPLKHSGHCLAHANLSNGEVNFLPFNSPFSQPKEHLRCRPLGFR